MAAQQKAIRAFETAKPVEIYRVIGRRPSDVWVDAAHKIAEPGAPNQPLKELVYWHTTTKDGDEIQERVGGMFVVTADGGCHPIALCPPEPLQAATAFLHAQGVRLRDAAKVVELLAQGDIVEIVGRRPTAPASRPGDRLLPEGHALVVEEAPAGMDQWAAAQRATNPRRFGRA